MIRVSVAEMRRFFVALPWGTTVWALKKFWELPDHVLCQVPRPWSWMLQAVQAFAVALLLRALAVVGYLRFLGVPPLVDFLRGREPKETSRHRDHHPMRRVGRRSLAPFRPSATPTTSSSHCSSGRRHA